MVRHRHLEALKVLLLFLVVARHTYAATGVHSSFWTLVDESLRFAVPIFFMSTGYFFTRSWPAAGRGDAVARRYGLRLLTALLFWGLFYAVIPPFAGVNFASSGAALLAHLRNVLHHPLFFLLTGYVYHLWFLAALAQGVFLLWLALRYRRLGWALACGLLLFAAALLNGPWADTPAGFHLHFDLKFGPAFSTLFVVLGALIARWRRRPGLGVSLLLASLGWALTLGESALLDHSFGSPLYGRDFVLSTVVESAGVFLCALAWPPGPDRLRLYRFSRYTLGIYALHPWLLELLSRSPFGPRHRHPLLLTLVVFALSLLAIRLLSRVRGLRLVT